MCGINCIIITIQQIYFLLKKKVQSCSEKLNVLKYKLHVILQKLMVNGTSIVRLDRCEFTEMKQSKYNRDCHPELPGSISARSTLHSSLQSDTNKIESGKKKKKIERLEDEYEIFLLFCCK
ncbi:hypothetical protein QLX08_002913 [Tetragonisca angustula]|uniref:Uncharacterized protein n=1 Tax=Tetragonisca angustula TaxID=166442 RepID=A0AAW1A900_9HYME